MIRDYSRALLCKERVKPPLGPLLSFPASLVRRSAVGRSSCSDQAAQGGAATRFCLFPPRFPRLHTVTQAWADSIPFSLVPRHLWDGEGREGLSHTLEDQSGSFSGSARLACKFSSTVGPSLTDPREVSPRPKNRDVPPRPHVRRLSAERADGGRVAHLECREGGEALLCSWEWGPSEWKAGLRDTGLSAGQRGACGDTGRQEA